MKKLLIALIVFLSVAAIGYYFGLRHRGVEVFIPSSNTSSTASPGTSFIIPGNQLSQNTVLQDLVGSGLAPNIPWYITRSAAITAYLLMFFIIVWGTGMTMGFTYKICEPTLAWSLHKYASIGMGIMLLIHMFSLLFDKFVNFSLIDILIPFVSNYQPLYLSLGILGFYTILVVIVTSLLIRLKYARVWRGVHYFVYPLFIFSFLHGLLIGTDSRTLTMKIVYWSTFGIFIAVTSYRFIFSKLNKESIPTQS